MSFKFEHPENRHQRYYARHREEIKQQQRGYKKNMTNEQRNHKKEYERDYYLKHRVVIDAPRAIYRRKQRQKVVDILGGKCAQCGEPDIRCLQVDHINGGGTKERKKLRNCVWKYYRLIIESVKSGEHKYQLLCANCNFKKRDSNNKLV